MCDLDIKSSVQQKDITMVYTSFGLVLKCPDEHIVKGRILESVAQFKYFTKNSCQTRAFKPFNV